jgi:hypothetical protein
MWPEPGGDMRRIKLGKWFDEPLDKMWSSYNEKIGKRLAPMAQPPLFLITTSKGRTIDLRQFEDRTSSIHYKIKYAAMSLEELTKMYQAQLSAIQDRHDYLGNTVRLTEALLFHTDIFFSFLHSALDYSSWMLYYTHDVKLIPQHVTLRKVVENLTSKKRKAINPLISKLRRDFEGPEGWVFQFEGYRDYTTHFARLVPQRQIHFSSDVGKMETTIFLLPDDPTVQPHTFEKNRELVPYCKETMISVIRTISSVFDVTASAL